jgi:transmembrane sensor
MEEPVDMLGGLMRDVAAAQRTTLERQNILAQVRMRPPPWRRSAMHRMATRLPRLRFAIPMVAVAAVVALWFGQGGLGPIQPPLSFSVGEDGTSATVAGKAGERLEAPANRSLPLRFSDGSRVTLNGGTHVRVANLDRRGATVLIEQGRAEVDVRHNRHTRWRLRAGPFEVTVTGTRFSIEWEEAGQALTVVMSEGTIEVRGPTVGGDAPVVVSAGQRFQATSAQPRWTLTAANAPTRAAPSESVVDEAAEPPPPSAPREPAAAGRPALSGNAGTAAGALRTWQTLARAGRYQDALTMVERSGFERACRRLGAEDLIQLGDAARLARSPARAEAAYRTAHRRFPGSDRPVFALGLVAFEQRRDFKTAAHWFDSYGRRYPNGALAREAVGREMESWHRAGDDLRARRAARKYLEQAPQGPYAPLARQISAP